MELLHLQLDMRKLNGTHYRLGLMYVFRDQNLGTVRGKKVK